MESFIKTSNRLPGEPLEAENPMKTCDLESHVEKEEKESVAAKAGVSEKIKRAHFEFDTTEFPSPRKRNSAALKSETKNSGLHTVIPLKLTV